MNDSTEPSPRVKALFVALMLVWLAGTLTLQAVRLVAS